MGRLAWIAPAFALAVLGGCDKGASAPARSHASDDPPPAARHDETSTSSSASSSTYAADRSENRGGDSGGYARREESREATPLVDGVPMWSDNRRHTAEENADYHFHHDGPDFGATDEKDFVAKVHHFIEHPPEGVQTVSRSNGDKLLYDPKSNTFAVERKDGAPRTMFKPHAGEAYWKEQQEKAASGDDNYGGRYKRSGGDEG